ncbi:MAG: HD domain-containing protein, partial [Promethearchaeota archaeon]
MDYNKFEKKVKEIISYFDSLKPKSHSKSIIVQDAIYGPIKLDELAVSLLETPLMQRLRYIKQLGCANYVFPSANHTRFEHSLGVYYITCRIIEQLENEIKKIDTNYEQNLDFKNLKKEIKAAAILHDIGQTPFSHDLEPFLEIIFNIKKKKREEGAPHELLSKLIIQKSGLISEIFEENSIRKDYVGDFITGEQIQDFNYPFAQNIINGNIDADKIDYLLRDAYFTGVPLGKIDHNRIINMFTIWNDGQAFQLAGILKGYIAFESLVISRFQMYSSVYNHHTIRAVSSMLLHSFDESIKKEEKENPSWLLYNIDASIIQKIGSLKGNDLSEILKRKIGVNLLFRNVYKRFLETREEIIKNQKVKNFLDREEPYLYKNRMSLNNELNLEIKNSNYFQNNNDFESLPFILIDIQKLKPFRDIDFALIDPKDPNTSEVLQLMYVGRFLRHIHSNIQMIPWSSYA